MMQDDDHSGDAASLSNWRTLAERVASERDPQKLSSLLDKLGDVLERAEKQSNVL